MRFLDLTLATPAENLALDEALLLDAEAGQSEEILRVWEEPQRTVVLGSGGKLADEVHESACATDAVAILRRSSGGGTVLLGKGCLCYTLVLAYERSPALQEILFSYKYILDIMCKSLAGFAPLVQQAGTSDLIVGERKFSGNAQQRKRQYLLHHGTLLYNFDLAIFRRYLRLPARQPAYRHQREHADFLMNLAAPVDDLKSRLRLIWEARATMEKYPLDRVERLVREKYSQRNWIYRH